jgi:hypothetical protein
MNVNPRVLKDGFIDVGLSLSLRDVIDDINQ